MEETKEQVVIEEPDVVVSKPIEDESKMVRRYMLTINNPETTDEEMLLFLQEHHPDIFKYAIFQREKGHETGTEHFQMFVQLTSPMRFRTFKNYFPRAHIEACKGTNFDCMTYCSKSDTRIAGPYEVGMFSEERGRSDIANVNQAIAQGMPPAEIKRLFPSFYVRHEKYIFNESQRVLKQQQGDLFKEDLVVVYIYGKSGVGKTYQLFNHFRSSMFRVTNYEKNPFDEYANENVINFDRFESQFDFSFFCNLLDVYPVTLPCRFANKFGNYKTVFITTNKPLSWQYSFQRSSDNSSWIGFETKIHFILNFESRNSIIVDKARLPVDRLKEVLPPDMWKICDFKYISPALKSSEQQVKMFTVIEDEDPVF